MDDLQARSFLCTSKRPNLGKYILAALFGALAACLAVSLFAARPSLALSEFGPLAADGILAVQARLSSDTYGLYLIDTQNQTVLLYGYGGPFSRGLHLLSARSFRYDRQLLDFNAGKPSPREVRQLIEAAQTTAAPGDQAPDQSKSEPKEPLSPE